VKPYFIILSYNENEPGYVEIEMDEDGELRMFDSPQEAAEWARTVFVKEWEGLGYIPEGSRWQVTKIGKDVSVSV